ncbi:unnamed protein product [Anisakis simplex]|uniref:Ribonuclease Z (inferred by orthology to a C. elegans protein) n=1 Tax=Anisakis simplex TaxID=6269 RepID=A0A0M3JII8_ANISI|nr:unnamed protein product [Anisakis simplex]
MSSFWQFQVPALPEYLDKLGNVSVAVDNLSVRFDDLILLPKLLKVFRELYQEELFEVQLRMEQRILREQLDEKQKQAVSKDVQPVKVEETSKLTRKRKSSEVI